MSTKNQADGDKIPLRELLEPLKGPLKTNWKLATGTILCGWAKFTLPMGIPMIISYLIDDVLLEGPSQEYGVILLQMAGLAFTLLLVVGITTYFRFALAHQLASNLQHHLRQRLFYHIQRLSMRFFTRHHAGSLGSRVSSDITYAGIVVERGLIQLSLDGLSLMTVGGFMIFVNPWLAIVCFAFLAVNAFLVRHYSPSIRRGRKQIQEKQSSVTGRAAEYFSAISVVKAFAGEQQSGREFSEFSDHVRVLQVANSKLMGAYQSFSFTLIKACQITIVLVGTYLILTYPDTLTRGQLVGFLLYVEIVNGSVQRLADSLIQIQDGFAALERIHDILKIVPSPTEPEHPVNRDLSGHLTFQNVSFGYKEKQVLFDLDLDLQAGKTYALVGPSGSGKSTLTQLMLRFYDPWEGQIMADGIPLPQIGKNHYRKHVAVVLQDPIIFSTSVKDNIGFATEHPTQEMIENAAKAAQAHEFIMELPQGYDTKLGERGVSLSGGQRQRIAIARALMRNPKLLILDEATSALDSVTERSIQDVVDRLRGSRTVVIIAHRLSTVKNVDEIIVMKEGRMVEYGSYDTLRQQDGLFATLLKEQDMSENPKVA